MVTKHHKPGGLEQQTFLVSQVWRLEVRNQGVSRTFVPPTALGNNLFQAFLLVAWPVATQGQVSHGVLPVQASHFLFRRTLVIWDSGPSQ